MPFYSVYKAAVGEGKKRGTTREKKIVKAKNRGEKSQ